VSDDQQYIRGKVFGITVLGYPSGIDRFGT